MAAHDISERGDIARAHCGQHLAMLLLRLGDAQLRARRGRRSVARDASCRGRARSSREACGDRASRRSRDGSACSARPSAPGARPPRRCPSPSHTTPAAASSAGSPRSATSRVATVSSPSSSVNTSRIDSRVIGATVAPTCGTLTMSPSDCSSCSASRTGMMLTSSLRARSSITSRSPGAISHRMMAERSVWYTNSCFVRGRISWASWLRRTPPRWTAWGHRAAISRRAFCSTASSARRHASGGVHGTVGTARERRPGANRRAEARDLVSVRHQPITPSRPSRCPIGPPRRRYGSPTPRALAHRARRRSR